MSVVVLERDDIKRIKKYEMNVRSLMSRYDELRRKYGDSHIAMQNNEIIDSDKDLRKLQSRLKRSGKPVSSFIIQYIYKERPQIIL